MTILKYVLTALVAVVMVGPVVVAAPAEKVTAKKAEAVSPLAAERAWRDKKLQTDWKGGEATAVLVFPGYTKDYSVDALLDRYTTPMNYLSRETGRVFVFAPALKEDVLRDLSAKRFSMVWINPEQAVTADKAGYIALVRQSEGIRPAVIFRAGEFASLAQLVGKRVGCVIQTNVCAIFRAAVIRERLDIKVVDVGSVSQDKLGSLLPGRAYDALVMRDTVVQKNTCSANKTCESLSLPEKYSAPGFFVMIDPKRIDSALAGKITQAFLSLDPAANPSHEQVMLGLDTSKPREMKFLPVRDNSDLTFMRDVVALTK